MLRIKGMSLKEQEKLCEKDPTQNVGKHVVRKLRIVSKYPGLRPKKLIVKEEIKYVPQEKAKSKKA